MANVSWDQDTCFESGDCCGLLPKVFRFEGDKLVIDTSAASEEAIRDAVAHCPSGALRIAE